MTSETDVAVSDARAVIDRVQGRDAQGYAGVRDQWRRKRRSGSAAQRLAMIAAANLVILVAAGAVGLFGIPLGMFGALAVMLLMVAVTLVIAFAPAARPIAYERLAESDVAALPERTERWLQQQRAALPPPARTLVDQIGARLEGLAPQIAALPADSPAAVEVRKLVGEQLPEFVRGYQKVPASLRATPRNGKTPDAQLADGLKVIDEQLAGMSAQLAEGDLDHLATRGRYLEIRYRGDEGA